MTDAIVIATRESRLALWQAEHVRALLEQRFGANVSLLAMTTRGDQILDRSLAKVGGKGLFVKELETALADGRADIAVHSLKDVPMDLPDGFTLAAVLEREDPRDSFISNRYASLHDLPQGATVGTSSLRKLDDGQYDAIVLAAAGLVRLGLASRIRARFDLGEMIPCAGQGALGIETRADAVALNARLATLADPRTLLCVLAERAVSRRLGGNCSMPLAAHAFWSGTSLALLAAVGHPGRVDASLLRTSIEAEAVDAAGAEALGIRAAEILLAHGAAAYLAAAEMPDDAASPRSA